MFKSFIDFLLRTLFREQDYIVGYDGDTGEEIRVKGSDFKESMRGTAGASAQIQFSANIIDWHFPAMQNDIYVRFRTGISEWSVTRFVGKDGMPGIEARYSADGQNWHTVFESGDKYIIFKLADDTFTNSIRFVGNDGKNIELQSTGEYIQWRVVGDEEWINLISLSELGGGGGLQPGNPYDFLITDSNSEVKWMKGYVSVDVEDYVYIIEEYARVIALNYELQDDLVLGVDSTYLFEDMQILTVIIYNNRDNDLIANIYGNIDWKDGNSILEIGAWETKEISLLPYKINEEIKLRGIKG